MNIFVLDKNPYISAQMMCDAHVVKMIVESCQLLSTHDRLTKFIDKDDMRYKITHQHHPCRTCLKNMRNYIWLCSHLEGLLKEYTYRYNKIHSCNELFERYWKPYSLGFSDFVSLPKCMDEEFKTGGNSIEDVVLSYRNYYKHKMISMKRFTYKKREFPEWLKNKN